MHFSKKLFVILFLSAIVWYSFFIIDPPQPKPVSAPATEFSAARAFAHVQAIAQQPHPLGSEANKKARTYLFEQLQNLGLQPVIQGGIAMKEGSGIAGHTKNIFAEIPGADPAKTILLMSHYDSVPNGPGAADDASGVAAILEVVRAIQSGEPTKNNIWILFTDGEERGLLGAEFFIDELENWETIDLVLNIEARGTSGASIMFETSNDNAGIIPHFAEATTYPVANSLAYTVYKLLPNNTDLSVMKNAGLLGMNFAMVSSYLNYHTMQDNPRNLSPRSLQHHGENLLSNVRHFGNIDFEIESNSDYVYFNDLTGGLTYYPASWSFPVSVVLLFLLGFYLTYLLRKKRVRLGNYLLSTVLFLILLAAGALLTFYGWQLIKLIHPEYKWLIQGETYNHLWYLWGFSALMISLLAGLYGWLQKKYNTDVLLSGIYTIWILISLPVSWSLPTAGYLFTWPALFGLLGWIAVGSAPWKVQWRRLGLISISLLPALFIIIPYIRLIQITLTTGLLAVSMVLLLLLAGLCWPVLKVITHPKTSWWSGGLFGIFLFCMIGAAFTSDYDEQHKKQNSLIYAADLDANQTYWISHDHKTDIWTRQFLGEAPSSRNFDPFNLFEKQPLLIAEAPGISLQPARITLVSDSTADSLRFVRLEIQSPDGGLEMRFSWPDVDDIIAVSLFGKEIYNAVEPVPGQWEPLNRLYYYADLRDPLYLDMLLDADAKDLSFEALLIRYYLPPQLLRNKNPRAEYMMPVPFKITDATIWKKTYRLSKLE